jgi:hypothetical protein
MESFAGARGQSATVIIGEGGSGVNLSYIDVLEVFVGLPGFGLLKYGGRHAPSYAFRLPADGVCAISRHLQSYEFGTPIATRYCVRD